VHKADCYQLGFFSRLHGLKGEIIAIFDTDQPQRYTKLESVFVDFRGELVPFFIEEMAQNSKGHFILKLEDVATADEAQRLIDREIFLPLEFLPPLSGKSFYFHEVVNFTAIDESLGAIGTIKAVLDNSAQPIFKIENSEGKEILAPAVDNFIVSINRDEKTVTLNLPEGLVDLYTRA
jgi:16S rRNA processing protein RimM